MYLRKGKEVLKIDLSKYVNLETGEPLVDEVPKGAKMSLKKDNGQTLVKYDDFAVISTDAINYLSVILNNSDFSNVLRMSVTTKTALNLLYNNNIPHTNASLQNYLKINSESGFIKLIQRLMKVGVLYQIKGNIYGEVRVMYMLNPFLSKKRNMIENDVISIFKVFQLEVKEK